MNMGPIIYGKRHKLSSVDATPSISTKRNMIEPTKPTNIAFASKRRGTSKVPKMRSAKKTLSTEKTTSIVYPITHSVAAGRLRQSQISRAKITAMKTQNKSIATCVRSVSGKACRTVTSTVKRTVNTMARKHHSSNGAEPTMPLAAAGKRLFWLITSREEFHLSECLVKSYESRFSCGPPFRACKTKCQAQSAAMKIAPMLSPSSPGLSPICATPSAVAELSLRPRSRLENAWR
mmetsp:Transcript_18644/g.51126  ORF Transcript_18644/g.51126 Transcript_18644/m.51126 type:complete len:234 (+) Transcript_18644:582-1283(+)